MSEKVKENLSLFHDNGIYLPTRSIEISGEFNEDMYQKTLKNLHALDSTEGAINLFINSGGGDTTVCMALYDAVKGCRNYVRGMVYGEACSSASLLLQACDERLMSPNSYLMIHYGEEQTEGHPITKKRWDAHYDKVGKWMESVYIEKIKEKHPRYTKKKLTTVLEHDTIYYPKEAIDLGLADKVEVSFQYVQKS